MIHRIPVTSREQWLAERSNDITASVVAGLRPGLHPYTSRLRLYKQHTGFEFPLAEGVRLDRGLLLEGAIAARVAQERPDWKIVPANVYLRDPDLRLGATPDFFVEGDPRGRGILQTKLSIPGVFEKAWRGDDGTVIPPMWVRLQALTEAMLEDVAFGAVACWIDHPFRNDVHICEFDRHAGAEATIRADVAQFWQDVEFGIEPEANGKVDAELVKLMYPESDPFLHIDLSHDNYLTDALAERARLNDEIAERTSRVEEIETELKFKMGPAEIAHLNGFVVTNKTQRRKAYTVKETSFRRLNVTDLRSKEDADNGKPVSF